MKSYVRSSFVAISLIIVRFGKVVSDVPGSVEVSPTPDIAVMFEVIKLLLGAFHGRRIRVEMICVHHIYRGYIGLLNFLMRSAVVAVMHGNFWC